MPNDEYNQGFRDGENDRINDRPRRNTSDKHPDYQEGYEHGYTGLSLGEARSKILPLLSSGSEVKDYWSYDIERSGASLVFSFESRPFFRTIRIHTSPNYFPYLGRNMTRGDTHTILPNQWLEGLYDGDWSYLTGADNR